MTVDKTSESESGAGVKKARFNTALALKLTMSSMRGHADFATLGGIHQEAVGRFDVGLSIEEAADLLAQMEGVRVERASSIEESRVFAPSYWKMQQ